LEWVRDVRDQCQAQHIAFFFKQWGGLRGHFRTKAERLALAVGRPGQM